MDQPGWTNLDVVAQGANVTAHSLLSRDRRQLRSSGIAPGMRLAALPWMVTCYGCFGAGGQKGEVFWSHMASLRPERTSQRFMGRAVA